MPPDVIQGEKFQTLANNETIYYCHTHDVNSFFDNLSFSHNFTLISHNSDGCVTYNPREHRRGSSRDADLSKIPPNLKMWFAQNVADQHPLLQSIPIGLENSYNFPELRKIEKLFNIKNTRAQARNFIYLNLNIQNNPTARQPIYDICEGKSYITIEHGRNGVNYENYLSNLHNHDFMICPEGNGIDVHQPWESLHIGTIPIQKNNNNNKFWRDLPICWLDDWSQLEDEHFLKTEHHRITNSPQDITKLDFNYWKERILSSI